MKSVANAPSNNACVAPYRRRSCPVPFAFIRAVSDDPVVSAASWRLRRMEAAALNIEEMTSRLRDDPSLIIRGSE